jgi:hypothetical protein
VGIDFEYGTSQMPRKQRAEVFSDGRAVRRDAKFFSFCLAVQRGLAMREPKSEERFSGAQFQERRKGS